MLDCEGLKKSVKKVGIYCICNLVNNRQYIGSTNNMWRRFTEHRRHLKSGIHGNAFLQNDYNKCGKEAFAFFILEECKLSNCLELEQQWLDIVWDNKQQCYNIDCVAGARTNSVVSEETKRKISLAKKGKKTGPCSALRREAIRQATMGKHHLLSPAGKQRMIMSKQKTYNTQLLAPDGSIYGPITNLHAFCREHKLDRASILRMIKGKQGRVGSWRLLYPIRVDRRFKMVGEDYKLRKHK